MLDAALEQTIVFPRARIHAMTSSTLKIAGLADSSHASNLFSAFTGQWIDEKETATEQNPAVRAIELVARKLFLLSKSSNELIDDSPDYERQLSDAIVAAISWHADNAFLNGSGAGQPLGALNASSRVIVPKEAEQAADTLLYQNVAKMLARLHPGCIRSAVWVASPTCIPSLLSLTVDVGTSGSHIPVLQESNGGYTLLTRPVFFTEKVPTLGEEGDISLIDFSQFSIGLRKQVVLQKSIHPGFTSDTAYYRGILRADGMPRWASAFTPANGDSLSWCVTLAER